MSAGRAVYEALRKLRRCAREPGTHAIHVGKAAALDAEDMLTLRAGAHANGAEVDVLDGKWVFLVYQTREAYDEGPEQKYLT